MASEEMRKKWGTIFMGEREASVEQLNAMQETLHREKQQKEQTEDYMERVRARAADRAREILGAAYTERQKVLDEAKAEILAHKRAAASECGKLKEEGETLRRQAQAELDKAVAVREEAEKIRAAAHEEGFQAGMDKAGVELHEFRAELGQSLATLLHAMERQRHAILDAWRADLAELVQTATQAATGFILQKEHLAIIHALVFQSLDLLEDRSVVSIRVNPADEDVVSDMFKAARERFPELRQWIVSGDERIEKGSVIAESGSGRVDLNRENFRSMVDGVLAHLALPEQEREAGDADVVRDMVEREVAHIASLTPELDIPASSAQAPEASAASPDEVHPTESVPENVGQATSDQPAAPVRDTTEDNVAIPDEMPDNDVPADKSAAEETGLPDPEMENATDDSGTAADSTESESLEQLEEELFPIADEAAAPQAAPARKAEQPDPGALAEGGFI